MMTLLAAIKSSDTICFGPLCNSLKATTNDTGVTQLLGQTFGKLVMLALTGGGFFMLFFLLWGGLDWVLSEGDKEKVAKAQKKIQNAVIGILIMAAAMTIWGVVTGDILGIIKKTDGGSWLIDIPSLAK